MIGVKEVRRGAGSGGLLWDEGAWLGIRQISAACMYWDSLSTRSVDCASSAAVGLLTYLPVIPAVCLPRGRVRTPLVLATASSFKPRCCKQGQVLGMGKMVGGYSGGMVPAISGVSMGMGDGEPVFETIDQQMEVKHNQLQLIGPSSEG
jgi:hypothetical protein